MKDEVISHLKLLDKRLASLRDSLEIENKNNRIKEIERKMAAPDFWSNQDAAQTLIGELKGLKAVVDSYAVLTRELSDEIGLLEMCDDERDRRHIAEAEAKGPAYEHRVEAIELQTLFTARNDARDVFLTIHAGAGGVDAMDWAEMLLRMYTRWLERNGYEYRVMELLRGEEAGLKRSVVEVRGKYPFGYLKSEIGVHRLVRISPFDANHRRQTSFAAVDVIPEFDDLEIHINERDLRIDTFSAGGPGGQHVNKTQSAVRITHLPTGIVVSCQNERSQQLNRKYAMRTLGAKLYRMEEAKREQEFAKLYGEKGEIAFGSQIRSYTMQPYTLVKDHRTDVETGNVQAVLDGEIDEFIEAFLKWKGRKY
ncbi:MAG: peptide chain release factor 2 [Planctomycetes bacterium]|nr:peptide chain release factor 2 [Planctomycetota bacterium]